MTGEMFFNPSVTHAQWPVIAAAFHTFSFQHLITLGILVALCLLVSGIGARAPSPLRKWLGIPIGVLLAGYAACFYVQQGIGHFLTWQYSLPLELCNLVLIACVISLFRPNQFLTEIAYFWGLGGVVQAILTPDLGEGFPSWDFTMFFWGHGVTLLAMVFLVSSRGFRPRRGSVRRMMIALNVYGLVVGVIDAIAGWNYGYLCQKPSMPSLLDVLGPWPWYLLSIELIAFLTFLVLDLPWRFWPPDRKNNKSAIDS